MNNKPATTESILQALQGQQFADWYQDEMERFILGTDDSPTKDEILADIQRMF